MRRLRADWIFDGRRLHANAILVMEDNGTVTDLLFQAGDPAEYRDAEYFKGILAPGFINAHCHLELSHMKGRIPKGSGLVNFILQLQQTRNFPGEAITAAMQQAEEEMLSGGIVAVGDIANSAASFPVKNSSKLRYHTFIEVFGFDPERAEAIFSRIIDLRATSSSPASRVDIVPHAPYSVSEKLFRLIGANAQKERRPALLSIHNQESPHEDPFYRDGTGDLARLYREFGIDIFFYHPYGRGALAAWLPWLGTSAKKLLVHNTYTTAEDMELAGQWGDTWWCLCPNANLYIERRLPDIPLFAEKGLKVVLGTDSLASNDSLSILEEMKTISGHIPGIRLEQLLQWATANGAEFFNWKHLGSFEKGKSPGVNLLSGLDGMHLAKQTRVTPLVAAGLSANEAAGLPLENRGDEGPAAAC